MRIALLPVLALCCATLATSADDPLTKGVPPKTPEQERQTFQLAPGFRIDLVASEPNIVDPVAMNFDENGRIYIAEMPGYPNEGVATGKQEGGKVKLLEDVDGDGKYEKVTTFIDGLRFPTGVMPWNGGLIICNAPDVLFAKDTNGDGKADESRVLYTGFELGNIQQLINGLQWGLDNWVYGVAGNNGGTITSPEKPAMPPVTLRGRGVRFHPEVPGSLDPTSGGGQYGLTPDDFQRWFVNTNSQHLRHVVLPDEYLRRNPYLPVPAVTLDIPEHGAACKVFRISPFEAWRVQRTTRRAGSADAKRFPTTELVPGGYVTSGCSPLVYCADQFPEAFRHNVFICDPANNLILRDGLRPKGATYSAYRLDNDKEFLSSTDNWFRPVHLTLGPDGALYVLDFYREVIETPLSLPPDIKAKLTLHSRQRGRVWRISAEGGKPLSPPKLGSASSAELVAHLADTNIWWRLTAQRLLIERQDKAAILALEKLVKETTSPVGKVHGLWTLQGLGALPEAMLADALKHPNADVREQALRLAALHLPKAASLAPLIVALADDESPRVRFQCAFTLGQLAPEQAGPALAKIARRDLGDTWTQTAVLSSATQAAPALLDALVRDPAFLKQPGGTAFITRLASLIGAMKDDKALSVVVALFGSAAPGWEAAVLEGLGQGMQNSTRPLSVMWDAPPPVIAPAVEKALPFFRSAARDAKDAKLTLAQRLAAVRLLAFGPFRVAGEGLAGLLGPQSPPELQLAAVKALAIHQQPQVAELLVSAWETAGPSLRRELLEAAFARPDRLMKLLDAVESKKILAAQFEPARVQQLKAHPNADLRQRATKLFAGLANTDRNKIVESYRAALELPADPMKGKAIFQKNCMVCHRLENMGQQVGPDLAAAIRDKGKEYLLIAILDPSREVDPRYVNYLVTTGNGRVVSGMLAVETPTSITLRRAEAAEDTILRTQIDEISATTKSLMPEELEKQIGSKQELADLIAYLQSAVK